MSVTVKQSGNCPFSMKIAVRLFTGEGDKSFGPGVAEMLIRIDRCGSLRTATMEMGISYSKAWIKLRECEKALGFPLLERTAGGPHGGGARLTKEGWRLLEAYARLEEELAKTALQAQEKLFSNFA